VKKPVETAKNGAAKAQPAQQAAKKAVVEQPKKAAEPPKKAAEPAAKKAAEPAKKANEKQVKAEPSTTPAKVADTPKPGKSKELDNRTLFVKNLPADVTEEEIKSLSPDIDSIRLKEAKLPKTKKNKKANRYI
jgi:RNA recognition motif-containing protein